MSNLNRNNGNQQFNQQQNFGGNQQQGNNFQQSNQQFQSNNTNVQSGQQSQRLNSAPQSNDWDQFFQQSNVVPVNNNNTNNSGNTRGENQYNSQQHQHSTGLSFQSNQNQSMVNDLAGSQLLRNNFQQNNNFNSNHGNNLNGGLLIDQSLKQSLARTVGLTPSSMVNTNGNFNGGGSNNFQQQQNHNASNISSVGRTTNSISQLQQNGSNSGGDMRFPSTQQLLLLQQQQQMHRRGISNNQQDEGGFSDQLDSSYDSYGGGNSNLQQQRGNINNNQRVNNSDFRETNLNGSGGGGYDSGAHNASNHIGGGMAQQQNSAPNPLSVLNKLNSIVAVTGGGLSAAQIQRAQQNPSAGAKLSHPMANTLSQQLAGNSFSGGLQQPQRNFHNNVGGGGGGMPNMLPSGANRNIVSNTADNNNSMNNGGFSVNKRPALEVLPGDVRYRGSGSGQQQQQQFFDNNSNQQQQLTGGSNIRQHSLSGSQQSGGNNRPQQQQQQSWQQGADSGGSRGNNNIINNNNNNPMNTSFNNAAAASVLLRDNQQQHFNNNNSDTNSSNNNYQHNSQSQHQQTRNTKWANAPHDEDSDDFSRPNNYNNNNNTNNNSLLSSPVLTGMAGGPRKIGKGGFPGTSSSTGGATNLNAMSFSVIAGKRDRSPSPDFPRRSSRSRSPSRDDFNNSNNNRQQQQHYQQSNTNYNNNNNNGGGGNFNNNNKRGGGGGRGGPAGALSAGGRGDKRNISRSPPRNAGNNRIPANSAPVNSLSAGPLSSGGRRGEVDYTHLPPHVLIDEFNAPSIPRTQSLLTAVDLYAKFPNLYVPADFVSLEVDWRSITASMYNDKICDLTSSVPVQFENLPAAMQPVLAESAPTDQMEGTLAAAVPVVAGLEAPRYTYLSADTCNNRIMDGQTNYSHFHVRTTRPVKFNAKVVISCGVQNYATERIDHLLPRKLRLLCGRRKGQLMLLGSSWCRELDGGDPMEDRSCLLNTARRAVYAQSLLDIFNPSSDQQGQGQFDVTSNLTKLCEVNYHRPREEINGKLYPEQEEITAIYLYTMQTDALPQSEQGADASFEVFRSRALGLSVGPVLNMNVDQFHEQEEASRLARDTTDGAKATGGGDSATVVLPVKEEVEEGKEMEEENMKEGEESIAESASDIATSAEVESTEQSPADEVEMALEELPVSGQTETENALSGTTESSAPDAPSAAVAEVVVVVPVKVSPAKTDVLKPTVPTVFLCPTPLPQDAQDDFSRRQEAVTLRMMPLSAVLSYSPDDCSERIFEASLGGEFVRSLVALSNANIVADFLLAENPTLSSLADVRVVQAVKRLRQIAHTLRNKASVTPVTISPELSAPTHVVAVDASLLLAPTTADDEASIAANEAKAADEEILATTAPVDEATKEVQSDNHTADSDQSPKSLGQEDQQPEMQQKEEEVEDPHAYQISDEEARVWRRRFVAACRWFDPEQDRFLSRDVVQLVLHSSTRNMSRVDVTAATDLVCKAGRVSYETHI